MFLQLINLDAAVHLEPRYHGLNGFIPSVHLQFPTFGLEMHTPEVVAAESDSNVSTRNPEFARGLDLGGKTVISIC